MCVCVCVCIYKFIYVDNNIPFYFSIAQSYCMSKKWDEYYLRMYF